MKQTFNNQSGFTLIELILCMVLMGILAIMVTPKNDGMTSLGVTSAAREIVSSIRYAQDLAMTTSDAHGFRVTDANHYEVYNAVTGQLAIAPSHQDHMHEELGDSSHSLSFLNTNYKVEFDSRGRPTVGGGVTLTIQYGSSTKSVQVSAASGLVNVL